MGSRGYTSLGKTIFSEDVEANLIILSVSITLAVILPFFSIEVSVASQKRTQCEVQSCILPQR